MRNNLLVLLLIFIASLNGCSDSDSGPPFSGTIFIDPDIITAADPTAYQGISYIGQGMRTMFDRRVDDWVTVNAYLFQATYDGGYLVEVQVNPEFGSAPLALSAAENYSEVIGRLPAALRADVQTVWIHKGFEPFGGGNDNILVHVDQADDYNLDGILEEALVHEAVHTSLDAAIASDAGWQDAQSSDGMFISAYAEEYPDREDVAESFVPYLAIRYRADRISASLRDRILQTIPNRIDYFDTLGLDMYPMPALILGQIEGFETTSNN